MESLEINPPTEQESNETPTIDWAVISAHCDEFFRENHTSDETRAFANGLIEMYPNDAEAITALADLVGFLDSQRELTELQMVARMGVVSKERAKEIKERKLQLFQALTQYQFLLTHFLVSRPQSEEYMQRFWTASERIAKNDHSLGEMGRLRDSVLSQAAIYQLFEELGKHPTLSHPKEDAFYAVDLWTDDHHAIQVKGAPKNEQFAFVPSQDEVSFPGVRVEDGEKEIHYNDYITHERQYMRTKLAGLERLEGKKIEGYLVVIPKNKRNNVTGKPNADVVEIAKQKLGL